MKIKLVILDGDGVLFSCKMIHYESLNKALNQIAPSFVIGYEDHLKNFDGKTSKTKLAILNERGLPIELNDEIWYLKQTYTEFFVPKLIRPEDYLVSQKCLKELKKDGLLVWCCTNSIKRTAKIMLECSGHLDLLDGYLTNEDVVNPKPSPEIFKVCMALNNINNPKETVILEDSDIGLKAATDSKANVIAVSGPKEINYSFIKGQILQIEKHG